MSTKRLDHVVTELHPGMSRTQAQHLIEHGRVTVNGIIAKKPSSKVQEGDDVQVVPDTESTYVSRAGKKLEHALNVFRINVEGKVCLDAGLSTGGFTDCLLQNGALKVYGVDVGTAQVHPKIADDSRVVVMENVNLRYLTTLPEPIDLCTLDLSFISVLKVMSAVSQLLAPNAELIVLIKPQFETEKHHIGTGGIVTDAGVHQEVVKKVVEGLVAYNLQLQGAVIESPLKGGDGNTEFLGYFVKRKGR